MTRHNYLWPQIEPLLDKVERPSRYIDHEYNAVHANAVRTNAVHAHLADRDAAGRCDADACEDGTYETDACEADACGASTYKADTYKAALLYPDTYELGQANQAIAILYQLINAQEGCVAERVFLPWVDMAKLMRAEKLPLFGLESMTAVVGFDLLGITLPHSLAATNILEALDLAGMPLLSCERDLSFPLVVGGGPEAYNPEPLYAFFDAFVIGEGEEVMLELVASHREAKRQGLAKPQLLAKLANIEGVYVPALYAPNAAGGLSPLDPAHPPQIKKRLVADFASTPPVTEQIVPYIEVAHDRLTVELLRGCTRGCRFCQAGMIYRPVRERSADMIVSAVAQGLACTGFDEVSLVSLSSTDHSQIEQILKRLNLMLAGSGVGISLPSQRLDAFGVNMARLIAGEKKAGLTFAPEAGTQRLRDVINKNVSEDDLLGAVTQAYTAGWRRCKLYFMIGLPTETDADICGIAELANRAYAAAKDSVPDNHRGNVRMTVSVAVFVPKAHTPFQWGGQIAREEIERRIALLRTAKLHRGIDLKWHDPATSRIEAALSRCGREGTALVEAAWRAGACFDAWSERFDEALWTDAAAGVGLDIAAMAERNFALDETLPWDHISCGVSKQFLQDEYQLSLSAQTSPDCSFDHCIDCGVCTGLGADIQLAGDARV